MAAGFSAVGGSMLRSFVLGVAGAVALVASANAADMYSAEGGLKDGPVYGANTWTGFYIGAHAGGVWGNASLKDDINDGVTPGPFPYSAAGAFGGGTAGYNLQRGHLVFGVEADAGYMDLSGSRIIGSANAGAHQDIFMGTRSGFAATARPSRCRSSEITGCGPPLRQRAGPCGCW